MIATILEQAPESASLPSRRLFVRRLLGAAAGTAAFPALARAEVAGEASGAFTRAARAVRDGAPADEAFWRMVKEQFPLRPGLILMNAANLCPAPYPVIETVFDLTRDVDADASFQNRTKFRRMRQQAVEALAAYVGADPDEVVITRNTTESNNVVNSGLDLGPGDEVLLWDQNHPTNNVAWDVRAERSGFTVHRVGTPKRPTSADDLAAPFLGAFTPRTRVFAFSHVSNISGVELPAAALCDEARTRGILTLVDGAQSFGFIDLDLHRMGCDFFSASTHKWLMGPKEAGILYVRKGQASSVWPLVIGVGWDGAKDAGARRFGTLGQRDDATVTAVGRAVDFHLTIGKKQVEARVRELASAVKRRVRETMPEATLHTPVDPQSSGGVVVFSPPGLDARAAFGALYDEHDVGCAAMGGDFTGIRLSPNIYNLLDEVDRVVATVASMAAS